MIEWHFPLSPFPPFALSFFLSVFFIPPPVNETNAKDTSSRCSGDHHHWLLLSLHLLASPPTPCVAPNHHATDPPLNMTRVLFQFSF
jgi:hypothetical protein